MPAAQPSKSSVANVIGAIIAAGLQPGAVRVSADGSFCVDVAQTLCTPAAMPENRKTGGGENATEPEVPTWNDGK